MQRAEGEGILGLCLEAQAQAVGGGAAGVAPPPPGSEVAAVKAMRWVRLARTTLQATQVGVEHWDCGVCGGGQMGADPHRSIPPSYLNTSSSLHLA